MNITVASEFQKRERAACKCRQEPDLTHADCLFHGSPDLFCTTASWRCPSTEGPVCISGLISPMQVLRVDYPLPNTGLAYKRKGVVRGEKWWNRPGSAGASPKGTAPLQQPAATPPVQKSSPLAKAQVSPGSL